MSEGLPLPQLPAATTLGDADLVYVVDDVAGTPTSKKLTGANLKAAVGGGGSTSPHPGPIIYISGRVYGASSGSAASRTVLAGRYIFNYLWIPTTMVATEIGVFVLTAQTDANARLGIYNSDDYGRPSSIVADAGEVDCSTTGAKTVVISQSLSPGLYWLALHNENGSVAYRSLENSTPVPSGILGFDSSSTERRLIDNFNDQTTYGAVLRNPAPSIQTHESVPANIVRVKLVDPS